MLLATASYWHVFSPGMSQVFVRCSWFHAAQMPATLCLADSLCFLVPIPFAKFWCWNIGIFRPWCYSSARFWNIGIFHGIYNIIQPSIFPDAPWCWNIYQQLPLSKITQSIVGFYIPAPWWANLGETGWWSKNGWSTWFLGWNTWYWLFQPTLWYFNIAIENGH